MMKFNLAMIAMILLTLGMLLATQLWSHVMRGLQRRWYERHALELEHFYYMGQIPTSIIPRTALEFRFVEATFVQRMAAEAEAISFIQDFVATYMAKHYEQRLLSRRQSVRMSAIAMCGTFGLWSAKDQLLHLLESPRCTSEEQMQLLLALAQLQCDELLIHPLLEQLSDSMVALILQRLLDAMVSVPTAHQLERCSTRIRTHLNTIIIQKENPSTYHSIQ